MKRIKKRILNYKWHEPDGSLMPEHMLYKKRVAKSVFFITAIILSNTLIALLTAAHINYKFDANLITRIYDIWFLILLVFGIFYLPYHPKYYGLNLNKLKYNLIIGFGIGGAGMLIAVIIRLMLIKYGHDEFRFNFSALSIMLCVLYFFSCFLQEALSRGFFQSYFIAVFTKTRSNRIIAIFLTALVFAQFHYIYSSGLALASFIYCFSTGFIYEKTRSIAGITIIHFLIGASMIQFTFMK